MICWLGGIGQRHGVAMIVLLHWWIRRTPLHGKCILHEQYIAILPINKPKNILLYCSIYCSDYQHGTWHCNELERHILQNIHANCSRITVDSVQYKYCMRMKYCNIYWVAEFYCTMYWASTILSIHMQYCSLGKRWIMRTKRTRFVIVMLPLQTLVVSSLLDS